MWLTHPHSHHITSNKYITAIIDSDITAIPLWYSVAIWKQGYFLNLHIPNMLDKADLWIKISNYLSKMLQKNPSWEEMFRNEVNRAISGAPQRVSSVWGG